jgi:S1-C subfamily serine protease
MSERRYSLWQVLILIAAFLGVAALGFGSGLALGFEWGKARGQAELLERGLGFLEDITPRSLLDILPRPELPFGDETDKPYLGVRFLTITPELAADERLSTDQGALIRQVIRGSPAARAGLEIGDIITAVEGESVTADEPLAEHILAFEPGDRIELDLLRNGRSLSIEVRLARPTPHS